MPILSTCTRLKQLRGPAMRLRSRRVVYCYDDPTQTRSMRDQWPTTCMKRYSCHADRQRRQIAAVLNDHTSVLIGEVTKSSRQRSTVGGYCRLHTRGGIRPAGCELFSWSNGDLSPLQWKLYRGPQTWAALGVSPGGAPDTDLPQNAGSTDFLIKPLPKR